MRATANLRRVTGDRARSRLAGAGLLLACCTQFVSCLHFGDSPYASFNVKGSVRDAALGEPLGAVVLTVVSTYEDGQTFPVESLIVDNGQFSAHALQVYKPQVGLVRYEAVFERIGFETVRLPLGATVEEVRLAFGTTTITIDMRRVPP